MAHGVHYAAVLRAEGHVGDFVDRQGINVAAQLDIGLARCRSPPRRRFSAPAASDGYLPLPASGSAGRWWRIRDWKVPGFGAAHADRRDFVCQLAGHRLGSQWEINPNPSAGTAEAKDHLVIFHSDCVCMGRQRWGSGRVWAFARCSPAQGEVWPGTVTYRNRCESIYTGQQDFHSLSVSVIAVVDKICLLCCYCNRHRFCVFHSR